MKFLPGLLILLTAFAAGASAAPITSNASARIAVCTNFPAVYSDNVTKVGTTSVSASVGTSTHGYFDSAWATASGTSTAFDVSASVYFGYVDCDLASFAASTADVILNDVITVPGATTWTADLGVTSSSRSLSAGFTYTQTAVEFQLGDNSTSWQSSIFPFPVTESTTITKYANGAATIPIYVRVSAHSQSNGFNTNGQIHVDLQDVRVYGPRGQLTDFAYTTASGLPYPVVGGTLVSVPEPASAALLIASGVLLLASRKREAS